MLPVMTFRGAEDFQTGQILLIDKPLEWTSFDVVNKLRYTIRKTFGFKKIKVGHAGTLDPLATGVLVLCTGKMTKQIEGLMAEEKAYLTTVRLGATTASLDAETPVDQWTDSAHLTPEHVETALAQFRGNVSQLPPVFSAKKVDGIRAYKSARAGETVTLSPVEVTIRSIELMSFEKHVIDGTTVCDATLSIQCSKGTYIRSIGRDLGKALGVGGTLVALRRTSSGSFTEDQLWTLDEALTRIAACPCA